MGGLYASRTGRAVGGHYARRGRTLTTRALSPFARKSGIPKKNARRPFRSCARLSSKKSHEGGGEHSADDRDKAIAVPTRTRALRVWNRHFRGPPVPKVPGWVQTHRIRFDPVHRGGPDQRIRTWNCRVNDGLPLPAALMVPAGAIRMARTAASKPLASGTGV